MRGEQVTIIRSATGFDKYGDPLTGAVQRIDVRALGVAPPRVSQNSADEIHDRGREGLSADLILYLPADVDVRRTDRVEVRGEVYDLESEPAMWRSPFTGERRGFELALRRVEG